MLNVIEMAIMKRVIFDNYSAYSLEKCHKTIIIKIRNKENSKKFWIVINLDDICHCFLEMEDVIWLKELQKSL